MVLQIQSECRDGWMEPPALDISNVLDISLARFPQHSNAPPHLISFRLYLSLAQGGLWMIELVIHGILNFITQIVEAIH